MADSKKEIDFWQKLEKELKDLKELQGLEEKSAQGLQNDKTNLLQSELKSLQKKFEKEETKVFLSGKYDKRNAIISIGSGAGGVDAQDWAEMLLRMYLRYAEKHGFKDKVLQITAGQEAGIKNVTLEINGPYAFGYLRREAGVHRLVRLSPFNADNLRQTSFALVEVFPDFEETSEVKIKPEDLKIDTYRASGPGGQYVNKTESAIRITHIPSGIVVACQSERLQGSNRKEAIRLLRIKLFQKHLREQAKEKKKFRGGQAAEWGNQIRSYVLHPYKMVKDHRTKTESSNPEEILDGSLDDFIEAEIRNIK